MSALTIILGIAVLALVGYITYLNSEINKRDNLLASWGAYADQLETSYTDLESYAYGLLDELNTLQRAYGLAITNWRIKYGIQPVAKLAYTDKTKTGDPVTRVTTQLGLFNQDSLFNGDSKFVPEFDTDGIVIYKPAPVKVETNGHKIEDNSTKETTDQNSAKDNNTSTSESPLFTPVITDDSTLLKSEKYGKYLDLLMASENVKKLSKDKYNYAKTMFLKWEKSKNPNTPEEYSKRVLGNKFGGNK